MEIIIRCNVVRAVTAMQKPSIRCSGLTIAELLVAISILALVAGSTFVALSGLNNFSNHTRARVAALSIVQNSVEEFLATPFTATPPSGSPLETGTRTTNNIAIVTDPNTGQALVSGTLVTRVEDGSRDTNGQMIAGRDALRLLRATYTLTYNLRGRQHVFAQTTLRANDQ